MSWEKYKSTPFSARVCAQGEDSRDDKQLVAYLVSNKKWISDSNELRNFLKEKLPDYMVPSAFVFLEALPLTFNGKIDLRNLPTLVVPILHAEGYLSRREIVSNFG